MAANKGGAKKPDASKKGPVKKAKKQRNLYKLYDTSSESIKRKNKTCPKCGPGKFLGQHKDRVVCGKCGYSEFQKK